jgi:enoyl-CoA hydratase
MTEDDGGPEVLTEEAGGVLTISINRPRQMNAMTRTAGLAIAASLDDLDRRDDLQVGILTGVDGNFCAGMDLKRFVAGERASIEGRGFGGLTERPPRKPLIAAVEGYAVAGGFEMVLACDLVVASSSAKFGLPEVRRGLVAAAGGLLRLPLLVPRAIAMELILTGNTLDAARAESLGLVNQLVAPGNALDAAKELAAAISRNAPLAIAVSKRVVTESAGWPQHEWFSRQSELTNPVFTSRDAIEGARAFAEKRAPEWSGS